LDKPKVPQLEPLLIFFIHATLLVGQTTGQALPAKNSCGWTDQNGSLNSQKLDRQKQESQQLFVQPTMKLLFTNSKKEDKKQE
jgi:hypothetical protein